MEQPEFVTNEHLSYLDDLRDSGVTNMFGAGEYLEDEFMMDSGKARETLSYWMKTFSERNA